MKRRVTRIFILLSIFTLFLVGCQKNNNSTFSIHFIDVGQGDAALVECDGHFMLIDGGDIQHGDVVYEALREADANHLDILAISHIHEDHIGGLSKALTWASTVDLTLCATDETNQKPVFQVFVSRLTENGGKLTKPVKGSEYNLGSAVVKVLDYGTNDNESLVLLITYDKTTFLFTGDMEQDMERRLCEEYHDDLPVTLVKVGHHGSNDSTSIRFLNMLTIPPEKQIKQYAVISVGKGNRYGHPDNVTLERLSQARFKVFRTDQDGDIFVISNGTDISIKTSSERMH